MQSPLAASPRSNTGYRWLRQIHLWIGAWGALAAIMYGLTGLVMNHRFGEGAWPQGDASDIGKTSLAIPAAAQPTPEQLSLWLRQAHQLDAQVIRKTAPGQPAKWTLAGGSASRSWSLEYAPGDGNADLKHSRHSPLAAFNRLHKGYGSGWWTLLADSFAIGMLLLGASGLWMWGRGRSAREMVFSVMGLSTLAFGAVVALALL